MTIRTIKASALKVVKGLLNAIGDVSNKLVIDFGCGKGRFMKILKKQMKSGLQGVDFCDKFMTTNSADICITRGSFFDLSFPDNLVDVVYCVEALEHSVVPENAIREMIRILKHGGTIIVIDKNKKFNGDKQDWELWFELQSNVDIFTKYCSAVRGEILDEQFILWKGIKK